MAVWLHGFSKEHGKVTIFKRKHKGLGLVVAEMKILGCGCVPIHFFVYLEDLMYKMMAWIGLIWTYQQKKKRKKKKKRVRLIWGCWDGR